MSLSRKAVLFGLTALLAAGAGPLKSQTLDQKAWNAVVDRLAARLPGNTPFESIHILRVIVPATWAKRDAEGLQELQLYAGAIPEATFSIDPSRMKLQMHQIYPRFVFDVEFPTQSPKQRKAREAAEARFREAYKQYNATLKDYNAQWVERQADLKARGEKITTKAKLDFRADRGDMFTADFGAIDDALEDIQNNSPPNNHWVRALHALRREMDGARGDPAGGLFSYQGGFATLDSIMTECKEGGPGWDKITFNSAVSATQYRSSNWNANGSWTGTFFSASGGGGGSNYEMVITTASEYVSLGFCNLTYIPMRPGGWFDMSFLQAIDNGEVKLREGSGAVGKRILGPKGVMPRMVKGAIVARSVNFEANLTSARLDEMRKSFAGSGGVRIGPFQIGGGGGSSEFKSEYMTASGGYGRSTQTDVPVIIAIITEPTK